MKMARYLAMLPVLTVVAMAVPFFSPGGFQALRIQQVANRIRMPITVVGSRAAGTANPMSDWDYVIEGATRRELKYARWKLPRGLGGGEINPSGNPTGIDIFTEPVDTDLPHVTFEPEIGR